MMRYVLFTLMLCMTFAVSCKDTVNSPVTAKDTVNSPVTAGFNKQPTLLMTLPSGYEAGEVTFSDDGFQAAVVLNKEGKAFMSINSVLSSRYDGVRAPVFHANSKQYAFVANKNGKECVVFNGKEGEFYDSVGNLFITAEDRLVYAAKRNEKWLIVSGNKVSQAFDSPDPSLYASSDGKRLAFVEQNRTTKKFTLVICSSTLKEYAQGGEYDEISDVSKSISGSHLAYRVVKKGKQTVALIDFRKPGCVEKEGRWYETVGNYALSNNGEHAAFFAQRKEKLYLVTAGNEWPCANYSMLFNISVSDKGSVLYTGVIKDSIILSRDGKVIDDRRESIENLTFSSDSLHSLFVAGPCPLIPTEKPVEFAYLVIDGHKSKKYDKIVGPRFSPDAAQVVFRARAEGKRFLAVASKTGQILREHSPYDAVWDFKFSPDGKYVGYGVRKGQELWWKAEPLQ